MAAQAGVEQAGALELFGPQWRAFAINDMASPDAG
jgi:hypothetical protein